MWLEISDLMEESLGKGISSDVIRKVSRFGDAITQACSHGMTMGNWNQVGKIQRLWW